MGHKLKKLISNVTLLLHRFNNGELSEEEVDRLFVKIAETYKEAPRNLSGRPSLRLIQGGRFDKSGGNIKKCVCLFLIYGAQELCKSFFV